MYSLITAALAVGAAAAPWGQGKGSDKGQGTWGGGWHSGNGGNSAAAPAITDADILNYALTLEHLEDTFYRSGLANFTQADFAAAGFDATFYKNLQEVSRDETTHVSFLTSALTAAGYPAVAQCTYNFGFKDVKTFVATASVLEGVGVSAYLGAAADIVNKGYLTAAGSILTVESRHSSYLRASLAESPFPSPFDTPLDFDEVYTLAAPFINTCPSSNPALPVKAFPALSLDMSTAMPVKEGSTVTFDAAMPLPTDKTLYGAWISVTGPSFVPAKVGPKGDTVSLTVPAGIDGQSYVVINMDDKSVTDDSVVAGPGLVEVTPAYEL